MRYIFLTCITCLILTDISWQTDFEKARQLARNEHKLILLSFSGSDWCAPCINLHKDIFESSEFMQYASEHLVLVNVDFPRLKKHKLSADQQAKNDHLADIYNKEGIFPLTILVTADGKVVKKWEGLPKESAAVFTKEIRSINDNH